MHKPKEPFCICTLWGLTHITMYQLWLWHHQLHYDVIMTSWRCQDVTKTLWRQNDVMTPWQHCNTHKQLVNNFYSFKNMTCHRQHVSVVWQMGYLPKIIYVHNMWHINIWKYPSSAAKWTQIPYFALYVYLALKDLTSLLHCRNETSTKCCLSL